MNTLRTSTILLALALVPAIAAASPTDKTEHDTARHQPGARGDRAAMTPAERAQRGLARADKMFTRLDANRDGVLVAGELPGRMTERFAKLDVDHDGRVTKPELIATMSAHARAGHGGWRRGGGEAGKVGAGGRHHGRGDQRGVGGKREGKRGEGHRDGKGRDGKPGQGHRDGKPGQ